MFFFGPNIIFPFSLLSPRPDTKNNTHDTQRELNNQISETESNCNKFSKFVVVPCYYSLFSNKCEIFLRQHACRVCVRCFPHRSMDVDGGHFQQVGSANHRNGSRRGGEMMKKKKKRFWQKIYSLVILLLFWRYRYVISLRLWSVLISVTWKPSSRQIRIEEKRKIIIILIKEIEEAKRRIKKNKSGPSLSYFVDLEISAAISGRKSGGGGGGFRSTTVWMRIHQVGLAHVAVFLPSFRQLQRCNPRLLLDCLRNSKQSPKK